MRPAAAASSAIPTYTWTVHDDDPLQHGARFGLARRRGTSGDGAIAGDAAGPAGDSAVCGCARCCRGPGDLLAVGVYNIGSTAQPASQTVATFQARLVSGQGDLLGVATLAPFYDLATTSVDLAGTPDGWGYGVFSAYKPASVDAPGSGTVTITLQGDDAVYSDSVAEPNSVTATSYDVLRDEQLAEYIRTALLVLEQNWSQVELVNAEGNITTLAQSYLDEAIPGWQAAGGGSGLISSEELGAGDTGETIGPSVWTQELRDEFLGIGGAKRR